MSELIIYKANSLVVSRYDLTEQETRLILYSVAKLNPTSNGNDFDRTVTIPYAEYAKFMDMQNELAWNNLNNAIKDLMSRTIEIVNPDPNSPISKLIFQWVNKAEFSKNKQSVILTFSKEIQPFLFNLKEFIKYKLENVKSLNNKYSMRIYEILLKSLSESKTIRKDVEISLEELKHLLILESNYPDFKEFNRRVLNVAVKDINKNSNLKVSVAKQGRPVNTLVFSVEKIEQLDLVQEIEKQAPIAEVKPTKTKKAMSERERIDQRRVKAIYLLLEQQEKGLIAMNKTQVNLLLSMRKKYEYNRNLYEATERQILFLDGIIAKFRPNMM